MRRIHFNTTEMILGKVHNINLPFWLTFMWKSGFHGNIYVLFIFFINDIAEMLQKLSFLILTEIIHFTFATVVLAMVESLYNLPVLYSNLIGTQVYILLKAFSNHDSPQNSYTDFKFRSIDPCYFPFNHYYWSSDHFGILVTRAMDMFSYNFM